jgi:DNA-binding winged helix-turn-helix (wHTH) protein
MCNSEIQYYDFDGFRVELKKHQLLKDGKPLLLTPKAFQILLILLENTGQVVEREDIYVKLWANSFVEESNLTQYIYTLRKILGKNPSGDSYIETVARRFVRIRNLSNC